MRFIQTHFSGLAGESREGQMSGMTGAEYHRARAAMEMERAAQAADPKTAALHRQLAQLHLLSAGEGEELEQTSHSLAPTDGLAAARA